MRVFVGADIDSAIDFQLELGPAGGTASDFLPGASTTVSGTYGVGQVTATTNASGTSIGVGLGVGTGVYIGTSYGQAASGNGTYSP